MKDYKVVDLSYSQEPQQHLKDVRAFHERDGWHLISVVETAGKWFYYLERKSPDSADALQRGINRVAAKLSEAKPGEVVAEVPETPSRPDLDALLRAWRSCMAEPRPSDWEEIISHLIIDTDAALTGEPCIADEVAVPLKGPIDYISAALARFREVITLGGFEVCETTMSFDVMEEKVNLSVCLEIEASLLNPER